MQHAILVSAETSSRQPSGVTEAPNQRISLHRYQLQSTMRRSLPCPSCRLVDDFRSWGEVKQVPRRLLSQDPNMADVRVTAPMLVSCFHYILRLVRAVLLLEQPCCNGSAHDLWTAWHIGLRLPIVVYRRDQYPIHPNHDGFSVRCRSSHLGHLLFSTALDYWLSYSILEIVKTRVAVLGFLRR